MKLITKEWLRRARDDLDVAKEIIVREHLTNMVAFHSQQAVEKSLKAIVEEFEIGFADAFYRNVKKLLEQSTEEGPENNKSNEGKD